MSKTEDVEAEIQWDFMCNGERILGGMGCVSIELARQTVAELNAEFGEGSHWVVPISEKIGARRRVN